MAVDSSINHGMLDEKEKFYKKHIDLLTQLIVKITGDQIFYDKYTFQEVRSF